MGSRTATAFIGAAGLMARLVKYQSNRAFLEPTPETFEGIEQAIEWAETEVPRMLRKQMNELVFHMALLNQGIARKMSFGPLDPSGNAIEFHELTGRSFVAGTSGPATPVPHYKSSPAAWQIPVRRISQRYYLGWKVRSLGPAVWQLYNDSREAYFIEFGIHTSLRRVRRPIRKLSLRRTMEMMERTSAWHRIWVDIYANPRYRHRGPGFTQHVSGAGAAITGSWGGALVKFESPFTFGSMGSA